MNENIVKLSYYLHNSGNGGPWHCGCCKHVNFDLMIICIKCKQGIRPSFQPGIPWICLDPECEYNMNDKDNTTCSRCKAEKWEPRV